MMMIYIMNNNLRKHLEQENDEICKYIPGSPPPNVTWKLNNVTLGTGLSTQKLTKDGSVR